MVFPARPAAAPLVLELFRAQVARTPERTALVHGQVRLSYAGLADRSSRLAGGLIQRGIGNGDLVAVLMNHSADLVAALLAVLQSGAAYVPLSPADPSRRIESILRDARASLVITAEDPPDGGSVTAPSVTVDALATGGAAGYPEPNVGRCDIAYVIYTSGSTGQPKGVIIEHGPLAAYLAHAAAAYPSLADRVLLHSPVSYDMAVTSLYGPLITGGTIEVTTLENVSSEAAPLSARPSFLKITPSHLRLLPALDPRCLPVQQLVIGGEALTAQALDRWRRHHPEVAVINEYGPTEATVGCCTCTVAPGEPLGPGPVPIGRPTAGVQLLVLDADLRPTPAGEIGELYIAGDQLARGYLGQPGLTAAAFVANPFGWPGSRMYRSGDLVRQRPDGLLEFAGRADDQVEIGGVRVEPGEVAAAVMASGQVSHVAVVARSAGPGQQRLVAYVTPPAGAPVDIRLLREYVSTRLPGPMRPTDYVVMGALPLTGNGKVDVAALPEPGEPPAVPVTPPRTPQESVLCRLFTELTGAEPVGIDDDFFALGGTSLAAARLVVRARREGISLGLQDVLGKRTARRLSEQQPAPLPAHEGGGG